MEKRIGENKKEDIKNRLVANKELSKNKICFRDHIKEYHPDNYKQLLELESQVENRTRFIGVWRGVVNDVMNLLKGWLYEVVDFDIQEVS